MKKFILILTVILIIMSKVIATEHKTDTLTKIETAVLGIEYPDQKLEQRIKRLEEYLYGRTGNGNLKTRLAKIVDTTKYTLLEEDNSIAQDEYYDSSSWEVADDSVDYPILDETEKQLGMPIKKNGDLNTRLSLIENKLFNKNYQNEDYFNRTERIRKKMNTDYRIAQQDDIDNFSQNDGFLKDFLNSAKNSNQFFNKGNQNISYKLSALEQKLLKNTYTEETNNDRLARLENAVFETQFYNQDEDERITRLESALKARKSSPKYDSNKFQQGLSTAMQIGAMVLMVLAFIL